MAKHKGRRSGRRGMRGLAGLGNMTRPGALGRDVLPAVLGIAVTLGGAVALRSFIQPTPGAMASAYRNAPLIGAAAGVAAGGIVYAATRKRAGAGPAMGVAGASILSGAFAYGMEKLTAATPGAMSAVASMDTSPAVAAGGTQGLAALVAEVRPPGTRGVIMEQPMRGGVGNPFGADINAPIRGSIVPNAFGRPQSAGSTG